MLGALDEAAALLPPVRPDFVLVTIPDIAPERLEAVLSAAEAAGAETRIVRRTETRPRPLAEASTE